jgi:sterol desaturase/sphingolipid hydroxylase (fatty acid hydroxylase superfamily)
MMWRLLVFIGMLMTLALLEAVRPWRVVSMPAQRWYRHLGLQVFALLLVKLTLPITALAAAAFAQTHQLGLFPLIALPNWLAFILALILLDLSIYGQHVLTHRWPLLWRLHRLHHSDRSFDVTTALRFHPLEIMLSMLWKVAVILALGASLQVVFVFELLLSSAALFNHANIKLAPRLDYWLRKLLVTPDMHRVHHSKIPLETNSNYGFFLPWWDWLFATYRQSSVDGDQLSIGLEGFGEEGDNTLKGMLSQPFRR